MSNIIISVFLAAVLLTISTTNVSHVSALTFESTGVSTPDTLIGHQHHQAVVVLPLRTDNKLWVGTISWTASKPVELRLLYDYNSSIIPDTNHGRPVTAPLGFTSTIPHVSTGQVAISLIKPFNGPAIVSSFDSGSMPFVAKAVAFHTISGEPFTVTYAVDATAR